MTNSGPDCQRHTVSVIPAIALIILLIIPPTYAANSPPSSSQDSTLATEGKAGGTKSVLPTLTVNERHRDFFLLSVGNYSSTILESKVPWIVVFHSGDLGLSWKKVAAELRGMVRFGMVHMFEQTQLMSQLKLDTGASIRVYPYGGKKVKSQFFTDLKTTVEAVKEADASLPCDMRDLKKDPTDGIQYLLAEAFSTKPPRFPVIFFTTGEDSCKGVPILFKAIASRLSQYFAFSRLANPSNSDLAGLGLDPDHLTSPITKQKQPSLLALAVSSVDPETGEPRLTAVQFGKKTPLNYANILSFLVSVNRRYRQDLPGGKTDDPRVLGVLDVLEAEKDLYDIREEGEENKEGREEEKEKRKEEL